MENLCWFWYIVHGKLSWTIYIPSMSLFMVREVGAPNLIYHMAVSSSIPFESYLALIMYYVWHRPIKLLSLHLHALLDLPTFHCWLALLFEASWTIYIQSMSIFMVREVGAHNLIYHTAVSSFIPFESYLALIM